MIEKYFVVSGSEKKTLEDEFHSIVFHNSWNENDTEEEFEYHENEDVIYIYELKEVHRRKNDSNSVVGVKEVWI